MILLLGAGLLCAGHAPSPSRSSAWSPRSAAASPAPWPPSRRWTRAPSVLKERDRAPVRRARPRARSATASSASDASWCAPTRRRRSSTDSTSPATRRRGTSTASSASRCSASASSACSGFLYLLGQRLAVLPRGARHGLAAAFGYVLPNVLLYNAGQKRETADAQRAARRDGPADRLGRGRPRLRRRREPCREEQRRARSPRSSPACSRRCRSAWAASTPCAPWPSARRWPTSSRSASPWSRPTASASRSPACCASRARRCAPSAASGPRRRPSRCRCGS